MAPRVVGRYALYGQIASGGMATVHLGRMIGPYGFTRVVAVKRLHDALAKDPDFVTMFMDEARVAARLQHPNIVSILDVVVEGSELLLVMDYVQGAALSSLLEHAARNLTPCTPRIATAIVSDMLLGLHHAHEAKNSRGEPIDLVHRDVSPQNVIVGVDGIARLLDFGIAKATGRVHQTKPNHLKGKVQYMPPELLERKPIDRRADVYASGVVLWETLTGRRLFTGPIDASLFARIVAGQIPLVSTVREGLERYDAVVARAVHRDPAERYATAHEMLLALEQCGPRATATEVASWVEPAAAATLAERAPLIHAIETNAIPIATPSAPEAPEAAPPKRVWPARIGVAILALLFLSGVAGVLATKRHPESASASIPSSLASSPADDPNASASAPMSAEPPLVAEPSARPSASAPSEKKRSAGTPRPRVDCDPPYVLDSAGHRRYKIECVRGM